MLTVLELEHLALTSGRIWRPVAHDQRARSRSRRSSCAASAAAMLRGRARRDRDLVDAVVEVREALEVGEVEVDPVVELRGAGGEDADDPRRDLLRRCRRRPARSRGAGRRPRVQVRGERRADERGQRVRGRRGLGRARARARRRHRPACVGACGPAGFDSSGAGASPISAIASRSAASLSRRSSRALVGGQRAAAAATASAATGR